MKHLTSLMIVVLLLIGGVRSQVITITFEGTLNGTTVPLDSIRVMNLTAGGDTTIYFPDHVLVLGTTGVAGPAVQVPVLRNQPNPFVGTTDILVSTVQSGQLLLQVHDATGREVAAYAGTMAAGQHRFRFDTGTPGVHVLTVTQDDRRVSHRMVALEGQATGSSLIYTGGTGAVAKSDRSLFTWTPGDELRYIGYATAAGIVNSAAIDEVPVATATRNFELFSGLACPESPTVTDIDGNVYRNVQIGGQCWMAENLKTTRNEDGTDIPNVTDNTTWTELTTGAWAHYENTSSYENPYGKLYNWYAVADPRNVCPAGWHVPTDAEWTVLTDYLGGENVAGGKMKSTGTQYWDSPNIGATNESGFSGLPGGYRNHIVGFFFNLGNLGGWWSASESGAEDAWYRHLFNGNADINWNFFNKRNGYSVRCLRD